MKSTAGQQDYCKEKRERKVSKGNMRRMKEVRRKFNVRNMIKSMSKWATPILL